MNVYACLYNFLVIVGGDLYEMSANPNHPNGVCLYLGAKIDPTCLGGAVQIYGSEIPSGIVSQVKFLKILN